MISKRIQDIMQLKGLNAAKFADAVEVQRSGISHILAGRNKPSLDLIQKILKAFDDVDADWLITGKGSLLKSAENRQSNNHSTPVTKTPANVTDVTYLPLSNTTQSAVRESEVSEGKNVDPTTLKQSFAKIQQVDSDPKKPTPTRSSSHKLKQVILIYEDGLFESYNP